MLAKGGGVHTNQSLINVILATIETPNLYLLVGMENGIFQGFIMGMFIYDEEPWIELLGMWTIPGVAKERRFEVFEMLKEWGRINGAKRVVATITRSPDAFFRFFHEPLGFTKAGYLLEAQI